MASDPAKTARLKVASASLWRAGIHAAEPGRIVSRSPKGLDLVLPPTLALVEFEQALRRELRQKSWLSALRCRFDGLSLLIFSLGFSIATATLFGLLGLYEELFKRLLIEGGLAGAAEKVWFILSALLFVFIVTLVPSLLAGEDSKFRDWLQRWYHHSQRVQRRLQRIVNSLVKDGVEEIRLWNGCAHPEGSWVWTSLVPALRGCGVDLTLHLRSDRQRPILGLLQATGMDQPWESQPEDGFEASEEPPPQCLPRVLEMLDSGDRMLLELLILTSTASLPATWQQALTTADPRLRGMVSLGLAEFILSRYGQSLLSEPKDTAPHTLTAFLRRGLHDYRLLLHHRVGHHRVLRLAAPLQQDNARVQEKFAHLQDATQAELPRFLRQNQDPLAGLVLLGLGEPAGLAPRMRLELLAHLIETTRQEEMYFLVPGLWTLLIQEGDSTLASVQVRACRGLPLTSLQHLCELLERSGFFTQALNLARHLLPIHPVKYSMDIARLLERSGQYQQAFQVLWDEPGLRALHQAGDGGGQDDTALRYHLHLSWTVVSGRLIEHQAEGLQALHRAGRILDQDRDRQREPYLLWRYHNNLANYAEWMGDLDACVRHHRQAVEIPGVEQKWISGSQVNLGIAYRMLFAASGDRSALDKALHFGLAGVDLKRQIGDHDELPVTLHNAVLSRLEAQLAGVSGEFPIDLVQALAMTEQGLEILTRTGSSKKLGLLLVERYLFALLAGVPQAQCRGYGQALQGWLDQAGDQPPADVTAVREILQRASRHIPQCLALLQRH